MPLTKYLAFACIVTLSCGRTNPTTQPPPPPDKTDCVVDYIDSYNNSSDYILTNYYYSLARRLDSSRNAFTICHFKYKDTLIVKREVLYTNTRALRNYDSLFYNGDGTLASVKMFAFDDTEMKFVNDINFQFGYTNKLLSTIDFSFEKNNKQVTSHYKYEYDQQKNIISNTVNSYDGSTSVARYYYRDTVNRLSQLRVPIGLFLTNTGLARPELLPFDLPLFLSPKAMNKFDDFSNNIGVSVEVSALLSVVTVKMNALKMYSFSLSCQ